MNKAMLKGYVGQDPKSNNGAVSFSLATSESWMDKDSGERKTETEWHNVVFFGKRGEVIETHVKKGQELLIEGAIKTNKWQDKEGNDRYTTQIIGANFEFCGSKNEGGEQGVKSTESAQDLSGTIDSGNPEDVPF